MNRILQIIAAALALTMGSHAVSMAAVPDMGQSDMAMTHSDQTMPADCATHCLSNLHQMSITGIPATTQLLSFAFVGLILFIGFKLATTLQLSTSIAHRPKPPDILNLCGAYRI